nr:sugar ABC transporter permease [uncultured Eisenbergiella sp.]
MQGERRWQRRKHGKQRTGRYDFLFVLPWVIGFLCFTLIPYIFSFYISFTKYNMMGTPKWLGFENYIEIFTSDHYFRKALVVTFTYVLIAVPLKMLFSLLVAVLLNNKLAGAKFYRTIYYIPSLLGSSVAISVVWKAMFRKDGVINALMAVFGIRGPEWIGNPATALWVLALLAMWQFGSPMLIFLAGLNQVPVSLLEAAEVDGATDVKKFFHITLPMISPMIFFNLVMQMIGAFQTFTSAMMVTNGGPVDSTLLYVLYIYKEGFSKYNFGYAAALSWVLMAIILFFTLLVFWSQNKWVYYEN